MKRQSSRIWPGKSGAPDIFSVFSWIMDAIITAHASQHMLLGQKIKMKKSEFKPHPWLLAPILPSMAAAAILIYLEINTDKGILLVIILAPFFYLGLEVLFRRIVLDDQGLVIYKLLRKSELAWPEAQSLDAVRSGNKIFIIIQTHRSIPFIISNTINRFPELVRMILDLAPETAIDAGAKEVLERPVQNNRTIAQAWIAFTVIVGILMFRLISG